MDSAKGGLFIFEGLTSKGTEIGSQPEPASSRRRILPGCMSEFIPVYFLSRNKIAYKFTILIVCSLFIPTLCGVGCIFFNLSLSPFRIYSNIFIMYSIILEFSCFQDSSCQLSNFFISLSSAVVCNLFMR